MKFDITKIRCEHSHTIEEHPACLLKMLTRFKGKEKPEWYDQARVGYLDIETNNLKPNFAFMFSWAIKRQNKYDDDGKIVKVGETVTDVMKPADPFNGNPDTDFHWERQDKRILGTLGERILDFDILITFYGSRFDNTFSRSRALYWKLPWPSYGGIYHLDMYYVVKNKLNLSSNRLESVCEFLGIEGKEKLKPETWRNAFFGSPNALKEILSHNVADVAILEELHMRLEPYLRANKTSI